MEDIHSKIDEIADLIKSRSCYKKIDEQVKKMENDDEVIKLASIFSRTQMEYSDALKHYEEDSKEVKEYYSKMLEAKNNLDSHPIVLEYYRLLSEVNEPLNYIQFKLLSLFKNGNHYCG